MQETSQKNCNTVFVIAIVMGLAMAYIIIPFMVQISFERVFFALTSIGGLFILLHEGVIRVKGAQFTALTVR